jgi:hypothetical protein
LDEATRPAGGLESPTHWTDDRIALNHLIEKKSPQNSSMEAIFGGSDVTPDFPGFDGVIFPKPSSSTAARNFLEILRSATSRGCQSL